MAPSSQPEHNFLGHYRLGLPHWLLKGENNFTLIIGPLLPCWTNPKDLLSSIHTGRWLWSLCPEHYCPIQSRPPLFAALVTHSLAASWIEVNNSLSSHPTEQLNICGLLRGWGQWKCSVCELMNEYCVVSVGVWKSRTRRQKTDREQTQYRINGKVKVLKYWGKKDRKDQEKGAKEIKRPNLSYLIEPASRKSSPCFPQLFVFVLHSSTCSVKCKRKFQIHLGVPTSFLPNSPSFTDSSSTLYYLKSVPFLFSAE